MLHHGRRRDNCERAIIDALESIGATVCQLGESGMPDLLGGFKGQTFLLECKDSHVRMGRGMKITPSGMRETQDKWWAAWNGCAPVVVTTPEEALAVVGEKLTASSAVDDLERRGRSGR